jgi:soluble lytic murein transglycosylase
MLLATALLVLSGVPGRPCTGDPAGTDGLVSPQERREARERVERSTILALVSAHQRSVDEDWRRQLADVIYEESIAAGVDPLMVAAIVAKESSFRSRVVSRKGAVGLMQLRPFVAREIAERRQLKWNGRETLRRPELNVRLGASYYKQLFERFEGDPRLALAAYHRGPTRVRRQLSRGTFGDSRYARNVLGLYQRLDAQRRNQLLQRG